ncbi:uncharacterized protein BP5553_09187 [Venustampulla echinocandica]|uniref:Vacuolar protein sorting-associated protein 51 homolog n=1 Tax=Venustampulla echinocandica TaxID=2656787 RepID=A0A370TC21_9HELO|nr:uncharacterized protein BP5553_09187 [Venustampulla echinocandica]RDL31785.1 hypothetical protein BP5553_09187 [Venustampulla echinocandica]
MSTIASPREASVNGRRVPLISTPTSSSRPSLDGIRSSDASPNRAASAQPKRANRTALREYYNLKKDSALPSPTNANEVLSSSSSIHDSYPSDIPSSELDSPSFDSQLYIKHVLETQSLSELLGTYNGILTDIRALDAEKKALVYDNYSKLIKATETIRKMRDNMQEKGTGAGMLDLAIEGIYERAEGIRGHLRDSLEKGAGEEEQRRRDVVRRVLDIPEKVRLLVDDGKTEEAVRVWEPTLKVLERWKERGVGGTDVQDCIDDGEAALRGEPAREKSWINIKSQQELKP